MLVFIWCFVVTLMLTACQSLPQLFQSAEKVLTDDAITIKVDRDAIKPSTDVHVNLDVVNNDNSK